MKVYHFCKKVDSNFVSFKISKSQLPHIISFLNLTFDKRYRDYWKNDLLIRSDNSSLLFYYIQDKYIELKDNYIVQEYNVIPSVCFSFFKTDLEETYNLYKGEKVKVKEYETYITITAFCESVINKINNQLSLFYIL
jgi:hypothetical protein